MKNNLLRTIDSLALYVELLIVDGLNLDRIKEHAKFYNGILDEAGLTAEEASVKFRTGTVPFTIAKIINNRLK